MIKVYCTTCKKELKIYPYRLKKTKDFYCQEHVKEAWSKYSKLGRKFGPAKISALAKQGKLPEGMLKGLEKGRYKGKECSEETRKKISIGVKNKVLSPEAKKKILQSLEKGRGWNKGISPSIETRKKISKGQTGKKINDNQRKGLRRGHLVHSFTKPELKAIEILKKEKIKFTPQFSIGKYTADLFIQKYNTLINIDGKYWHNYPKGRIQDRHRDQYMFQQGFKVLTIWEDELFKMKSFLRGGEQYGR